jgi:hypothetical protein
MVSSALRNGLLCTLAAPMCVVAQTICILAAYV